VANFSVRCVSREKMSRVFGAVGSAKVALVASWFAKVDAPANTEPSTTGATQNDDKTPQGRKPSGKESSVTENPLAALLKQRTYKCKKRISRTTPLPELFRPGKRAFAKVGAPTVKRWRLLQNSEWFRRYKRKLRRRCDTIRQRRSPNCGTLAWIACVDFSRTNQVCSFLETQHRDAGRGVTRLCESRNMF
jgi:hypothetical protein